MSVKLRDPVSGKVGLGAYKFLPLLDTKLYFVEL